MPNAVASIRKTLTINGAICTNKTLFETDVVQSENCDFWFVDLETWGEGVSGRQSVKNLGYDARKQPTKLCAKRTNIVGWGK